MEKLDNDVIIIGAGIAGLACARHLMAEGKRFLILEADTRVGGRIKSDVVKGFILDHGFQVLQTAYPEARRLLDFSKLDLKPFAPGVAVQADGRLFRISDPIRRPQDLWSTLTSPIGNFADRMRILQLFMENRWKGSDGIFKSTDTPAIDFLKSYHFSNRIIERFFKPFFAGACLDPEIKASSRVFRYLFTIFASGDAALPAKGMGEIPAQLAAGIPPDNIRFGTKVESIENDNVILADGQEIKCKTIVVATEGHEASRLLKKPVNPASKGERCLYFSTDAPPIKHPYLILNGEGKGRVNNIAVPTLNAPSYSSSGKHLIAVVVLGDASIEDTSLETTVIGELTDWFGSSVQNWEHLKTYTIDHALPDQSSPLPNPQKGGTRIEEGIYVCGEYQSVPGIQWALLSGRMTAEQIMAEKQ